MPEPLEAQPVDVPPLEHPLLAQVADALGGLDTRPVPEHVEVFDAVHRSLQDALASLDGA